MSLITPKSIVITTVTNRAGKNTVTGFQLATPNVAMEETDSGHPRKRRRLTHLTPEERMMRRKLKNRVAAQTARDRKKAKMDTMEVTVSQLQAENKRLMEENNALRQQSVNLTSENQDLKKRLGQQATGGVVVKKEPESESAALSVSLQQEQIQTLFQLMTRYVAFLLTLSLMNSSSYWIPSHIKVEQSCVGTQTDPLKKTPPRKPHQVKWWGPQQQNWTPSMN